MRKITVILLAFFMMISFAACTYQEDEGTAYHLWESKIQVSLKEEMAIKDEDDLIPVWIFRKDMTDEALQEVIDEYGRPTISENYQREMSKWYYSHTNDKFIEENIGDKPRKVFLNSDYTSTLILEATKSEIEAYAKLSEVTAVKLYQEVLEESDEPEDYGIPAQYIRAAVKNEEGMEYPSAIVIRSVEELNTYYQENFNGQSVETEMLEACIKYDKEYFKKHILVMVRLEEGSGSIRHVVTDVKTVGPTDARRMTVFIKRKVPMVSTCDMAWWHILVEVDAKDGVKRASDVTVLLQ